MSDRGAPALPRPAAGGSAGRSAPGTAPAWVPAAVALALFAAAGVAVLDDYGVATDEGTQRAIGLATVSRVLGADSGVLPPNREVSDRYYWVASDRYYGVAFEAPLLLAERVLGLTDSRAILLSRHLLTHLFFLTGGWFCYLLIYRLFGNRWLALFALLLFLLHPRIYAHSFFNSKDLPFLAMFMLALYLVQRAFRRDTVAAFALCGIGVGLLVNLRVMGLMLFAAVPALRALDLVQARGWPERRRTLAAAAAFALAAAGTLYATSPYLWLDPFAIVDMVTTFARHPHRPPILFQGELVRWPSIPRHYLPTWMAITTPPATLLLGLIGAAAVLGRGIARPRRALRHGAERFALLLVACLVLPAAAVVALRSSIYDGWRQMYFLYAPLCLLAVCGLRWLLAAARRRGRLQRGMIYLLAAAALAGMAAAGVRLHPHQATYFNFLVDRRTPERLQTQYDMGHWYTELREGLEYLLARFPDATLHVDGVRWALSRTRLILPAAARRRIVITGDRGPAPDFFVSSRGDVRRGGLAGVRGASDRAFGAILYARRIYHNTLISVTALDLSRVDQATAAPYRAAYQVTVAGEPLLRLGSQFDLYLDGRTLTWVKEPCRPEDTLHPFLLRVGPPEKRIDDVRIYGVRFDGRCLIRRRLPDYPLRTFEVGRWGPDGAGDVIEAAIDLRGAEPAVRRHWPDNPIWQAQAAITAGARGAPAVRAAFDLYLDAAGATLTYHQEPCAPADLQARFFLHLFPVDAADLPAEQRPHGFHNRSFEWGDYGQVLGPSCVAIVPLPAWDRGIARIGTGQFTSGQGQLWGVEFPGHEASGEYWQAHAAITAGERGAPAARAAFDLYLDAAGATLTYHQEACAPADLQARFFLHLFPVDAADLSAEQRPHGFHNRSFDWREHGQVLGPACVAIVSLPAWDRGIARIGTGQFISGQGQLWGVEFPAREASRE